MLLPNFRAGLTSLLRLGSGRLRGLRRWRRLRRIHGGIDPAGVHPCAKAFQRLWVDLPLAHEATERRLDVTAGAAETVVEIEVAEGGVEIIAPHEVHHAATEPDAFRIRGRPPEHPD